VNFSSKLIEQAVDEFARLPGIGRKTAFRFVLHLLKQDKHKLSGFSETLISLRDKIKSCKTCCNVTEQEICEICASPSRDGSIICVVEDIRDVIAIENTTYFKGQYHVLGGIISPMDGIGPNGLASAEDRAPITEGGCFRLCSHWLLGMVFIALRACELGCVLGCVFNCMLGVL
jgi:recombination protein RecR